MRARIDTDLSQPCANKSIGAYDDNTRANADVQEAARQLVSRSSCCNWYLLSLSSLSCSASCTAVLSAFHASAKTSLRMAWVSMGRRNRLVLASSSYGISISNRLRVYPVTVPMVICTAYNRNIIALRCATVCRHSSSSFVRYASDS